MPNLKKYRTNFQRENETGNDSGNDSGNETEK